jgi:UDP:flavonoid glycosyltransferase YjiC (YdhE family)
MRILITSFPGYGHLCPLIPLARAIQDAGHQVAIATSNSCAEFLSCAGIQLLVCDPLWHETQFDHDMDLPQDGGSEGRLLSFLNTVVYPQTLRDVRRHVQSWRPDIIVSNDYDAVGRTVAEVENILFAAATHNARVGLTMRSELQAQFAARLRELCGLPKVERLVYPFHWLHLNFAPAGYSVDGAQYVEADNEYSLRPEIYDDFEQRAKQPFTVRRGADERPVLLCTMGTVFNKNTRFLKMLIAACADQPYRVIITLGPSVDVECLGALPANIEVFTFLPLSQIVPQVDFCICHGGTSTLLSIMLHGKPVLVIPQGADQLFNAIGCAQLGIGIALNSDLHRTGIDRPNEAANSLRGQIEQLLAGDSCVVTDSIPGGGIATNNYAANSDGANCYAANSYVTNGRRVQTAMAQLPGMRYAVELLEKLYLTGMPVTKES